MTAVRSVLLPRTIAINVVLLIALLLAIEIGARVFVRISRGTATAGLQERTLNLEYERFVMFGPEWDRRLAEPPADGVPTVMLVGGSTAQGFAPEILERALTPRFGRMRVVNAAFGGYNVRQEAVVAALWGGRLKPAALVSLDGQNDAIPMHLEGQHSLTVVARGLGASRPMVLQAFVAFKQPLAADERAFTTYAHSEPVMRSLSDRAAAGLTSLATHDDATFLDARAAFNGIDESIFADDVHFRTSRGYEVGARAIASALPDDAMASARGAGRQ